MCDVTHFNMPHSTQACRPLEHLAIYAKKYPTLWREVDFYRENREGLPGPEWPNWCFFPLAGWTMVLLQDRDEIRQEDCKEAAFLAALGTWRTTQGMYRFDQTLFESIIHTPVEGNLPSEVLMRLPEWCVYIETPGMSWMGENMRGFYAYLNWDGAAKLPDLYLLIDNERELDLVSLVIGPWSLVESLTRTANAARAQWQEFGFTQGPPPVAIHHNLVAKELTPLISLILYLCSQNAEINSGDRVPTPPKLTRTKKRFAVFSAEQTDKVGCWRTVGVRPAQGISVGIICQRRWNARKPTSAHSSRTLAWIQVRPKETPRW